MESKRSREPLEHDWIWYTRLYHNRQDSDDKAVWQSSVFIPEIYNKVETACSLIKGALLDDPNWFRLMQDVLDTDETQIRFIQKLLAYILEDAAFVDKYMLALREGFLLGSGCLAFSWDDWIERKPQVVVPDPSLVMSAMQAGMAPPRPTVQVQDVLRNGLKIRHVPLWALYPDPYGRNFADCKYLIEEMAVDRDEIEEGVATGRYYPDTMDRIGSPIRFDLEDEYRRHQTELEEYRGSRRKRDKLQIYYGDFYGEDRKLCLKNWRAVIANERAVIALGPNPYFTGRRPYLWSTPLPFAGRPWGRPIVAAAASMNEELNKLFNLMVDNALFAVQSIFRKDPNKSTDPIDLTSVAPGMVYNGEEGFLEQIAFNFVGNNLWPMIQFLQNGINDATRISEIAEGQPTTKGRPTATEIQTVAGAGQAQIHNLARDLERNDLEEAVQTTYEMTMQFLSDASNPRLRSVIEEWHGPAPVMDELFRLKLLDTPFKVKARGISMILKREEMAQKLQQALQLAIQMGLPPLNVIATFYQLISSMGVDPEQIGLPPSPQMAEQAMQQIQMQQQAQMASTGGGGPTRPAAPEPTSTPQSPPRPPRPEDMQAQMRGQMGGPTMPGQ